jgi:AAA domain
VTVTLTAEQREALQAQGLEEEALAAGQGEKIQQQELSSWAPVDLGPVLAGEIKVEPPSLMLRTDGEGLIYRGRLHALSAEPEAGKGWLTLHTAAEALAAEERVLMLDFEVEAAEAVERLRALGVADEAIRERFLYARPDEALGDRGWRALERLMESPLALVILDGVTEAMALEGLSPLDNVEVAKWLEMPRRLVQRTGAAGVLVDHVAKDKESRGRYPFGAQHKLAGVDVAYSLKVIQPFGRGKTGVVEIRVQKDRPGHVRRIAEGEQVAIARLHSEEEDAVRVEIEPPEEHGEFRPTVLMERISEAIEMEAGLTKNDVRRAVTGKAVAKDLALRLLVAEGYVKAERDGQAIRHTNVRLYRQVDDFLAEIEDDDA